MTAMPATYDRAALEAWRAQRPLDNGALRILGLGLYLLGHARYIQEMLLGLYGHRLLPAGTLEQMEHVAREHLETHQVPLRCHVRALGGMLVLHFHLDDVPCEKGETSMPGETEDLVVLKQGLEAVIRALAAIPPLRTNPVAASLSLAAALAVVCANHGLDFDQICRLGRLVPAQLGPAAPALPDPRGLN